MNAPAFWKALFGRLCSARIPSNLYGLLVSYRRGRSVTVRGETFAKKTFSERGCSQGSVLGPELWNLVFNELIILLDHLELVFVVAYRSDFLLVIEAKILDTGACLLLTRVSVTTISASPHTSVAHF